MSAKQELLEMIESIQEQMKTLNKNQKILNNKLINQEQEIEELKKENKKLKSTLKYNQELLTDVLLRNSQDELSEDINKLLDKDDV